MLKESENTPRVSQPKETNEEKRESFSIEVPQVLLPKGGGALKGIDEKFSVNSVNGTASFSIPIPFTEARSSRPSLAISYNSGGGNGIFGLGWGLGLSSVKRKTDKELPQYFDSIDSDTYLFSSAEDLVPELKKENDGTFTLDTNGDYVIKEQTSPDDTHLIRFYIPRIESLFSRIERWTEFGTGIIRWRIISRENITSLLGWTSNAVIADPSDPKKIFEWLPEFVFDGKGNCSHFLYKKEDDINLDTTLAHNRNRSVNGQLTYTNTYLEKVLYGNKTPYKNFGDAFLPESDYLFSAILDYGEYNTASPFDKVRDWDFRSDAFSDYKAGFEIRTTRLCRRVMLFHHFTAPDQYDGLVRSLNFSYDITKAENFTFLKSITLVGYLKNEDGSYRQRPLPPIGFEYQKHEWNTQVKTVNLDELANAPVGLEDPLYQFTDLFNEGLSGILTEQADGWFYKRNLGDGKFEPARLISPKPSFIGLGTQLQLADLDADGGKQLVSLDNEPKGYFELNDDNDWQPFRSFKSSPTINFSDPNTKMLDLNGDGRPEVLITEETAFTWYESEGRNGFKAGRKTPKPLDEESGPAIIFADKTQSIFLADMCGHGRTDIVRIRNGEVSYWPNLGYGRFGARVSMDNAPFFDHPDAYNPLYIKLADIDGSGTTDIIYLGRNKFSCWLNLSGNSFSDTPFEIEGFPEIYPHSKVSVMDLLGTGVSCIVWSSPLPKDSGAPLRYIDIMSGKKPHLMVSYKNNMGKEVTLEYAPSTRFYLDDKKAGKPWVTKLHFPVHLVTRTIVFDKWRNSRFVSSYSYHHGYYDHPEREFRGFGRVEQVDIENFGTFAAGNQASPYITNDLTLYQPPVKTITWYHTGAFLGKQKILKQFGDEYFEPSSAQFHENPLPEPDLEAESLTIAEWPQALRACKGMVLRQEIYELDVDAFNQGIEKRVRMFSSAYHNCHIRKLQPMGKNKYAVFLSTESEAITYNYELDLLNETLTPDPRIVHTLNLNTDELGNILEAVTIAYPRILQHTETSLPAGALELISAVQKEQLLTFSFNHYTEDLKEDSHRFRLRLPCETKTFELTGFEPDDGFYYTLKELRDLNIASSITEIPYHILPNHTSQQKRCVEWSRTLYFADNLTDSLPWGKISFLGLVFENYKLALTGEILQAVFTPTKLTPAIMTDLNNPSLSGYLSGSTLASRFPDMDTTGQYWIRSGIAGFNVDAANHFYLPERYADPFGQITTLEYDPLDIFIQSSTNALGKQTSVTNFDYRVMNIRRVKDINDNFSEIVYDVTGMPILLALSGKGTEADNLTGFTDTLLYPDNATLVDFFTNTYDETKARQLLGNATARYVYYFGETLDGGGNTVYGTHPACGAGIKREIHVSQGGNTPLQISFEYSDGLGTVLVSKSKAEPETTGGPLRWLASGKIIMNNKGNPVKQFEPYFSPTEHHFEEPVEVGVTPVFYYDAPGRLIRTELPDGTFSKLEFSPWYSKSFDPSDTVTESLWFIAMGGNPAWDETGPVPADPAQRAAFLTKVHANTPAVKHFDSLGRDVIAIDHNRFRRPNGDGTFSIAEEKYLTYSKLDPEGKPLWMKDNRGNRVVEYITPTGLDTGFVPCYDIAGNLLFQHTMDGGDRWTLTDATGQPFYAWDVNNRIEGAVTVTENRNSLTVYDAMRRPVEQRLRINAGDWIITERIVYGESQTLSETRNLNGQVFQQFDGGGLTTNARFDFKGNLLESTRQFTSTRDALIIDWNNEVPSSEVFTLRTTYNALNRAISMENWQLSGITPATFTLIYNERGLLKNETINVNAVNTQAVLNIEYNAKGQRTRIQYGNGTTTRYNYDSKNFRLIQLRTTRTSPGSQLPLPPSNLSDPNVLQNLYYTYDPVGNITEILDDAYEPVFFGNQQVEPRGTYTYDALYRLVEATGRENLNAATLPGHTESNSFNVAFPVTDLVLRNYKEQYTYDSVGNIIKMQHIATSGNWTRNYDYAPASNRLNQAWEGTNTVAAVNYNYDIHGNILNVENTDPANYIRWDYRDMIVSKSLGGGGEVFYGYGIKKQRSRKFIRRSGNITEERLYLGGMELYRRHSGGLLKEEIETHHLFVDDQRILLVENVRQSGTTGLPQEVLCRYQYSNHLRSASLELNGASAIISYEEYHPFGTTAYQAKNSGVHTVAKRYRYTGMEKDEETGFAYHTARYYLPWLGRWSSTDPAGIQAGLNYYWYSNNNPVILTDASGLDARLTVDQTTQTITYSTTSHFYGTQEEIDRIRPAATRATQFFADNSGTVNINGVQWRVVYDVQFQFHDTATEPLPTGFTSVINDDFAMIRAIVAQNERPPGIQALHDDANLQSFQTGISQVRGFRRGDSVVTFADLPVIIPELGARPDAQTISVSASPTVEAPTREPSYRGLIVLDRGNLTTEEALFRTLTHEIGHTLGFNERYSLAQLGRPHERFETDFMTSRNMANPSITLHQSHLEASAQFALYAANGRNISGTIRNFNVDVTGGGGSVPQFLNGVANPDYDRLQSRLRSTEWNRFRRQFAPPVPPPQIRLFPSITGRGTTIPDPFQRFPTPDRVTPAPTVPILQGTF